MPMIRILGARWNFASDDLFIVCLFDGLWRSIQSLILLIGLISSSVLSPYQRQSSIVVSCGFLLAIELLTMVTLFTISYLSTKGSVLDVSKRRPATGLFTWRLICLMPLEQVVIGIAIDSMISNAGSHLIPWMSVAIVMGIIGVITTLSLAIVAFDPTVWVKKSGRRDWITWLWHVRIVTTAKCCCLSTPTMTDPSMISAFEGVADTLSRPFSHHDLVPSDGLAAMILLASSKSESSDHAWISDSNPTSWMTLRNARRYCCHALAIYSWPIYVYLNSSMITGIKWLLNEYFNITKSRLLTRRANYTWEFLQETPEYGGRSFSALDLKAFRLLLPDENCKLCYLDLDNKLLRTPFSIVIDEKEKSVVIVIRGTMSVRDVFTDACAVNHDLSFKGIQGKCHLGMYEVANQVLKELVKNDLLKTITDAHQGYQLVVCGHSLGAGAAIVLTMKLRESGAYPNAICYAFSSPKSVTEDLAVACNEFCLSVTVGHDIVARLGMWSLDHLKTEMVEALAACPLPKYKIFFNALLDRSLINYDNIEDGAYNAVQKDALLMTETSHEELELHVPGCILHFDPVLTNNETEQTGYRFMPRSFF